MEPNYNKWYIKPTLRMKQVQSTHLVDKRGKKRLTQTAITSINSSTVRVRSTLTTLLR